MSLLSEMAQKYGRLTVKPSSEEVPMLGVRKPLCRLDLTGSLIQGAYRTGSDLALTMACCTVAYPSRRTVMLRPVKVQAGAGPSQVVALPWSRKKVSGPVLFDLVARNIIVIFRKIRGSAIKLAQIVVKVEHGALAYDFQLVGGENHVAAGPRRCGWRGDTGPGRLPGSPRPWIS